MTRTITEILKHCHTTLFPPRSRKPSATSSAHDARALSLSLSLSLSPPRLHARAALCDAAENNRKPLPNLTVNQACQPTPASAIPRSRKPSATSSAHDDPRVPLIQATCPPRFVVRSTTFAPHSVRVGKRVGGTSGSSRAERRRSGIWTPLSSGADAARSMYSSNDAYGGSYTFVAIKSPIVSIVLLLKAKIISLLL